MSNINEESIEKYVRYLSSNKENPFKDIEKYAIDNHIPIIHPEVAQLIRVLINITKPKKILEIGTAIGYSALVMLNAMDTEGKVVTIEKREDMINIAKKNIENHGYSERIEIIKGDAAEILPELNDEFDFIFIDAAKGHYMDFFNHCLRNLIDGGIIVSDNVLYKGMIASDELVVRRKKTIVKRMRSYLDYITSDDGLESTVLPLGDGVAITYKKGGRNY